MITNRSAPTATIVPVLVYDDVESAIEVLVGAFGFAEHLRSRGRDGTVNHEQLRFGDGSVIVGRQGGPFRAPSPDGVSQYVHVTVPDVDRHFLRAQQYGVRVVEVPHDMPFGERQYTVQDPAGHWWTFSQHVADVAPEEWGAVTSR